MEKLLEKLGLQEDPDCLLFALLFWLFFFIVLAAI